MALNADTISSAVDKWQALRAENFIDHGQEQAIAKAQALSVHVPAIQNYMVELAIGSCLLTVAFAGIAMLAFYWWHGWLDDGARDDWSNQQW